MYWIMARNMFIFDHDGMPIYNCHCTYSVTFKIVQFVYDREVVTCFSERGVLIG